MCIGQAGRKHAKYDGMAPTQGAELAGVPSVAIAKDCVHEFGGDCCCHEH